MVCILPTIHCRSQHCWKLLHPFAHHCQQAGNNSQHCCANNVGSCASVCTQPYWLISRSTITFHRYFLCSRFCEFHSKCEFGEQEVWVVLTFFERGSSYHLTDTKINDVKVIFLDYHIKTSCCCNNLQPECLPESSASSPSAADKSINDSKVRKENPFTNSVVHLLCTREVGL